MHKKNLISYKFTQLLDLYKTNLPDFLFKNIYVNISINF